MKYSADTTRATATSLSVEMLTSATPARLVVRGRLPRAVQDPGVLDEEGAEVDVTDALHVRVDLDAVRAHERAGDRPLDVAADLLEMLSEAQARALSYENARLSGQDTRDGLVLSPPALRASRIRGGTRRVSKVGPGGAYVVPASSGSTHATGYWPARGQ